MEGPAKTGDQTTLLQTPLSAFGWKQIGLSIVALLISVGAFLGVKSYQDSASEKLLQEILTQQAHYMASLPPFKYTLSWYYVVRTEPDSAPTQVLRRQITGARAGNKFSASSTNYPPPQNASDAAESHTSLLRGSNGSIMYRSHSQEIRVARMLSNDEFEARWMNDLPLYRSGEIAFHGNGLSSAGSYGYFWDPVILAYGNGESTLLEKYKEGQFPSPQRERKWTASRVVAEDGEPMIEVRCVETDIDEPTRNYIAMVYTISPKMNYTVVEYSFYETEERMRSNIPREFRRVTYQPWDGAWLPSAVGASQTGTAPVTYEFERLDNASEDEFSLRSWPLPEGFIFREQGKGGARGTKEYVWKQGALAPVAEIDLSGGRALGSPVL